MLNITKTLKTLCDLSSIGSVNDADEYVYEFLKDKLQVEKLKDGTVVATIKGSGQETIILDAHIDEVGFIVTEVFDSGFLRVSKIGGIDDRILPSTAVNVFGREKYKGVFSNTPAHLLKGNEKVVKTEDLFIDCSYLKNPKDCISVGSFVTFENEFIELSGNVVSSKSLDNRASVLALLIVAETLCNKKITPTVKFVFSKAEELGLRGAKTAAFNFEATASIVVDTTFGNFVNIPPHKTGILSRGALIGVSPVLDKTLGEKLKNIALSSNIPFQYEIMGGKTSTNADMISTTKSGIPTALLSIPIRNMHTPSEVVNIGDINNTANIIIKYLLER